MDESSRFGGKASERSREADAAESSKSGLAARYAKRG